MAFHLKKNLNTTNRKLFFLKRATFVHVLISYWLNTSFFILKTWLFLYFDCYYPKILTNQGIMTAHIWVKTCIHKMKNKNIPHCLNSSKTEKRRRQNNTYAWSLTLMFDTGTSISEMMQSYKCFHTLTLTYNCLSNTFVKRTSYSWIKKIQDNRMSVLYFILEFN